MKKCVLILFMLCSLCFYGQNMKLIMVSQQQAAPAFLDYPNKSNPNPELITNDAASLDIAENVNAINLTSEAPVNATRTSVASTNGYTNWSREVEASTTGTSRRDRLEVNGVLTIGEIYQVDLVHACSDTTDNTRVIIVGPSTQISDIHAAHTDVQLHSYEFTANQVNFEIDQYVRVNSTAGQTVTYNVSLKLKDD